MSATMYFALTDEWFKCVNQIFESRYGGDPAAHESFVRIEAETGRLILDHVHGDGPALGTMVMVEIRRRYWDKSAERMRPAHAEVLRMALDLLDIGVPKQDRLLDIAECSMKRGVEDVPRYFYACKLYARLVENRSLDEDACDRLLTRALAMKTPGSVWILTALLRGAKEWSPMYAQTAYVLEMAQTVGNHPLFHVAFFTWLTAMVVEDRGEYGDMSAVVNWAAGALDDKPEFVDTVNAAVERFGEVDEGLKPIVERANAAQSSIFFCCPVLLPFSSYWF